MALFSAETSSTEISQNCLLSSSGFFLSLRLSASFFSFVWNIAPPLAPLLLTSFYRTAPRFFLTFSLPSQVPTAHISISSSRWCKALFNRSSPAQFCANRIWQFGKRSVHWKISKSILIYIRFGNRFVYYVFEVYFDVLMAIQCLSS